MTKRQVSNWGKVLFFLGFVLVTIGAMFGNWFFLIPGIGFALILLSFVLLAYGSRVGDQQD